MSQQLPARPNLEWLKKISKERLEALRVANPKAKLSEAQLAVAREYGFLSWRKLEAKVEEIRAALPDSGPLEEVQSAASVETATDELDMTQLLEAAQSGDAVR